jgi:hypothetical protein
MRDLAPDIVRQRLLIEGYFSANVDEAVIRDFFAGITEELGLRTYGKPTIHAPGGKGRAENQGYDAFVPLIDSGISLYVWTEARFLACVAFTCKTFDTDRAVEFTSSYFSMEDIAWQVF